MESEQWKVWEECFYSPCSNFVAPLILCNLYVSQHSLSWIRKDLWRNCNNFQHLLLSLPLPFRRTVEQSARNGTFLVKGVIEIIFIGKFSQNFPRHEDDDDSTTSLVCTAIVGFSHILWCGLLSLSAAKAMREASLKDKDNKFPHLIFVLKLT